LTFDLHGLLPSPEDVEAFEHDADPQAYERLVDRLLASPHYGERWARHWLDTIHFADTHGFEHDLMRTNAWRYRDYVIESFNRDTPWARFIREQLAADVCFPNEPRLTVALGFLGAGPWDQSTAQTAPRNFEYLDRDDIVTQTMATFTSTTVNCARCHDHKFDPVTQQDYYALQAVFAAVGRGDLSYDEDPGRARERHHWQQLLAAAEKQDEHILLTPENQRAVDDWEAARGAEATWATVEPEVYVTSSSAVLRRMSDGVLIVEGPRPDIDTYTITAVPRVGEMTALRLEVLADPSLPKNGPGRQDNGNLHLSEFSVQVFADTTNQPERLTFLRATADFDQTGWTIRHAIDGDDKTAWGIHPREGESHVAVFELERKRLLSPGTRLVFQLKQLHGQSHLIGKFRLSLTSDDAVRTTVLPVTVAAAHQLPQAERTKAQQLELAAFVLRNLAEEKLAAMPPPLRVFAAGPVFNAVAEGGFYKPWGEPKVVHLLKRGDINQPGAEAQPGAVLAVSCLSGRFASADVKDEGARRRALADWLADPNNPLTWRSVVNRVWYQHFGRGLVDTLNDFGRMGSLPTHPDLLNWLSCEFRDGGGSLKILHRVIVTSAAYRRAAQPDATVAAQDPEDRWLWRHQSRRLDAESFRDSVLTISGWLDLTMRGPGVQQFKLGKPIQLTPTVDYSPFKWDMPGAGRRSIYRFVYRGLPDPFMDALDFPDAAQLAPTRPFSASPLQSLALLNNDFVLFHCERMAAGLEKSAPSTEDRVRGAFRLAFQREPNPEEQNECATYCTRFGLPALCRVLLNSNEFLFIN
jgi:hypothetical protein